MTDLASNERTYALDTMRRTVEDWLSTQLRERDSEGLPTADDTHFYGLRGAIATRGMLKAWVRALDAAAFPAETSDEQTCQHMVTVLWRSLNRLHHAVKECARVGFQESSPTGDARHFAIWTDLNDAQKDAELKLKHFSAGLPVKTSAEPCTFPDCAHKDVTECGKP